MFCCREKLYCCKKVVGLGQGRKVLVLQYYWGAGFSAPKWHPCVGRATGVEGWIPCTPPPTSCHHRIANQGQGRDPRYTFYLELMIWIC